jgi:hypothetical protein
MNDASPILKAQGLGHTRLLLFQDHVRIERKGWRTFLLQGTTGNKDIPLSRINDIQFKKVGFLYRYIRFSFVNSAEKKGFLVHFRDVNSLRFRAKQQPAFEVIKFAIEDHKNTSHSDQQ